MIGSRIETPQASPLSHGERSDREAIRVRVTSFESHFPHPNPFTNGEREHALHGAASIDHGLSSAALAWIERIAQAVPDQIE